MSLKCNICNKDYKSYKTLWSHNNKCHNELKIRIVNKIRDYKCTKCNKTFTRKDSLTYHINSTCKNKNKLEININVKKEDPLLEKNKEIDEIKNQQKIVNNQLINIIIDKTKIIEELKENKQKINQYHSLILNDNIINMRINDNYINALELCKANNKDFYDWYELNTTKELLLSLVNIIIFNEDKTVWINSNFVVLLAHWVSPNFVLPISNWINKLNKNNDEIKIKLLEDLFIKKQQRKDIPEKNVIYIITTEDNKKKRNYIIGKAKELKNRLSTYNKTAEHEVVYYKGCINEEIMNLVENMVLKKLEKYKEKANRDRFILPMDKNISFFTNIIDQSINFFY